MKKFNFTHHKGFSLIELFIALAVGLGLLAGVLSVFVSMKTTTKETSTYGELQENGRFALSVLSDDLLRQDFWGDYVGTFDLANLNGAALGAPGNDCQGEGINNGTFPVAAGHFRTLWG
ncbi:MAG: prepilin-type N-terminal cleavage/methylation domain-containing protein, partial [Thalassotalea sp.]|nr:prepilin-type N-terminal cleavage/methylation domain-containing protein [Thalassotalea sp.]